MSKNSKKKHLACVLSFICALSFAQTADVPEVPGQVSDESAIFLGSGTDGTEQSVKNDSPSSVWILFRVVLVLALVCAGIYGVVYLLKKSTGGKAGNDPYLKNVASLYFSPNKSVQVVSLGGRAYLVGVTDQAINLIAEVTDKELVDAMNLQSDKKNPVPQGTFQSVLSSFIPGLGKKSGNETKKEATESLVGTDFLRAQRERLGRSGRPDGSEE